MGSFVIGCIIAGGHRRRLLSCALCRCYSGKCRCSAVLSQIVLLLLILWLMLLFEVWWLVLLFEVYWSLLVAVVLL